LEPWRTGGEVYVDHSFRFISFLYFHPSLFLYICFQTVLSPERDVCEVFLKTEVLLSPLNQIKICRLAEEAVTSREALQPKPEAGVD
jgi:hypothetical protein